MEDERRIRLLTLVRLAQQLVGEAESLVGGAPATSEGVAELFFDLERVKAELDRILTLPALRDSGCLLHLSSEERQKLKMAIGQAYTMLGPVARTAIYGGAT